MIIRIVFLNLFLLSCFVNLKAQVKVALQLDESAKSTIGNSLFCDKDYNCGLFQNENEKQSVFGDAKILIKVWRNEGNFLLSVDTNRNSKLTDEKKVLLKSDSSVIIKVRCKLESGKVILLPFEFSHEKTEEKNVVIDEFNVNMHYISIGTLTYKSCSSKMALSDMNFDGKFDSSDAERGTNFKIDRNNDNKFWGKEEHHKTNEIIEFCGQNFLISTLNNAELILTPTDLKLAKIGEIVPNFSFDLLNGESIKSENLKGKAFILDFWASWCVPCVENLAEVIALKKEYQNELSIFSVNVDKSSRKDLAIKIINEKKIFEFSSVRGLGESDSLWKTFGGANLNRLSIPLYVLVDKNGIVRYADSGGKNLIDLKNNINKLLVNQ